MQKALILGFSVADTAHGSALDAKKKIVILFMTQILC